MLRRKMDMSRLAGRLLVQVAASMAATLIGSTLFTVLPNVAGWTPGPPVELTSGGKYAARIPGAEPQAAGSQAAAEPVRRTPLPVLTRSAEQVPHPSDLEPTPTLAAAVDLAWDNGAEAPSAALAPSVDKPVRAKPHGTLRSAEVRRADAVPSGARHAAEPVLAAAIPRLGASAGEAAAPTPDEGMVPKIMASARSLWTFTASTGGTIVDHLTP